VKGPLLAAVGVAVLALALLGTNELALLLGGGLVVMALRAGAAHRRTLTSRLILLAAPGTLASAAGAAAAVSLATLFFTFLKIGAVLYGSGYVLLAFLRNDFVDRLGWLTDRQLLDAVAVGQFTPGPVFTTATFVGYLVAGWAGAVLATLAIFLPSFVFVAASHPLIPRIRGSPLSGALLDGVNIAALGLMATVTWQLARAAIVDVFTAVLALVAGALLLRTRVNSAWLVIGGAIVGLLARRLLG
jgi:chromate transporter